MYFFAQVIRIEQVGLSTNIWIESIALAEIQDT